MKTIAKNRGGDSMIKILNSVLTSILSLVLLFVTLKKNCKKGFLKYLVTALVLILSVVPVIVLRNLPYYNAYYNSINPDEIIAMAVFIFLVSIVISVFFFIKNHSKKNYPKYIFLGVTAVLLTAVLGICFNPFSLRFKSVESAHRFEYGNQPVLYAEGVDSVLCLRVYENNRYNTDIIAKSGNKFKLDASDTYISDMRLHYGFTAEVKSYDYSNDYYIILNFGDFAGTPDDIKIDIPNDIQDVKLSDSLESEFKLFKADNTIIAIAHLKGCTPKILKNSYELTVNGTKIKFDNLAREDDYNKIQENKFITPFGRTFYSN